MQSLLVYFSVFIFFQLCFIHCKFSFEFSNFVHQFLHSLTYFFQLLSVIFIEVRFYGTAFFAGAMLFTCSKASILN